MTKLKQKKIKGIVVKGLGEGKKIGLPTANISTDSDLSELRQGVYAVKLMVENVQYKGVAHYGARKVFNEPEVVFEVYIFDFDKDIYSKYVEIELVEFLRPTLDFESVEEMMQQIEIDKKVALKYLSENYQDGLVYEKD